MDEKVDSKADKPTASSNVQSNSAYSSGTMASTSMRKPLRTHRYSRRSRDTKSSFRSSFRKTGFKSGKINSKKKKKRKPVIYILGRQADPLPLNRNTEDLANNADERTEQTTHVGDDTERWDQYQPETSKQFAPMEVLGLGEMIPDMEITEEELDALVTVKISETETMELLYKPSTLLSTESYADDIRKLAQERSELVAEKIGKHIEQSDKYHYRSSQTLNNIHRTKKIQTSGRETKEMGCQATTYDIYDAYNPKKDEPPKLVAGLEVSTDKEMKKVPDYPMDQKQSGSVSTSAVGTSMGMAMGIGRSGSYYRSFSSQGRPLSAALHDFSQYDISNDNDKPNPVTSEMKLLNTLLHYQSFRTAVETAERAVVNNSMNRLQKHYRAQAHIAAEERVRVEDNSDGVLQIGDLASDDDVKDGDNDHSILKLVEDSSSQPELRLLWRFEAKVVLDEKELPMPNVSCMAWNTKNKDLLAVGYGSFEFDAKGTGNILMWSIKNPLHPCKRIDTETGVTCLEFSADSPNLLAAGFYDGSVVIYDIREPGHDPMLKTHHHKGKKSKHSEAVWGVRWITTGGPGSQQLTSISSDGCVLLWNLKKGLEPKQIMQLKRITNTTVLQGSSKVDVISREASALCIDFFNDKKAQNLYVAGTEGGLVHKCSVLYSEQTLENYMAHTGPVYGIKCSLFCDLFLTCSADESIALWDHKSTEPLLRLKKDKEPIQGLAWAPYDSCVFASVSRDSTIKVWDLSQSTMNPLVSKTIVPTNNRREHELLREHRSHGKQDPESRPDSPLLQTGQTPQPRSSPQRAITGASIGAGDENCPIPPELTCVTFAPDSPVVLVGGSDGVVRVYRITNVSVPMGLTAEDQAARLDKAVGMVKKKPN